MACAMTAGIRRTIHRLLDGTCGDLHKSTRAKLDALGLTVQREAPRNEPPLCYPLHRERFFDRCMELGIRGGVEEGE